MRLRGFKWIDFFKRLYERMTDTDVFSRSAQVAFYFSFSLFPLLLFLVSLFGLVLNSAEGLKEELFSYLRQLLPGAAYHLVRDTVEEVVSTSSPGKLTIGLVVTLWSASAGVDSLRSALNAIYERKETRSWLWTKAMSIGITLLMIVFAAFVLAIVFYGWKAVQFELESLGIVITSPWVLITIQWISIFLVLLVACEILFNLLPNFERFRWKWLNMGSFVSIVLWAILIGVFRFYLQYFNTYSRTYGSLGAVIVLMLWLYLTALSLMIGGAINAVLRQMREEQGADTSNIGNTAEPISELSE